MSQIQPLETYKLGGYRTPIPCVLCGEHNLFEATTCANCSAPMDLSRITEDAGQRVRPQLIVPVGASGTGKTVYLGMLLDILSRQGDRSDITTHGASSVTVQHEVISALGSRFFPDPTAREPLSWRWAHCRLARRTANEPLQVFVPDMSGWSLMRDADDESCSPVRGILRKSTGIMLFIDAALVQSGDKDEEFLALKTLRYIEGLMERPAPADRNKARPKRAPKPSRPVPPISVVLAKADECDECFDSPADYVRGQMPNLWQALESVPLKRCFATSAVGATAEVPLTSGGMTKIPLRVEPRGILEPFRWQLGQALR